MHSNLKYLSYIFLAVFTFGGTLAANALNICAVCGKEIEGQIFLMTDQITGQKVEVCSNCVFTLPRCYLCGLPIKPGDELKLPDGRYLCARDAKSVVLNVDDVRQVCAGVKDDLDRLFGRFTSFPTNVGVVVIDQIDAYGMFQRESPELLGCTQSAPNGDAGKRYKISLMTGLPLAELKETCAHEYGHTWVGDNVSPERHARIARDAEEGFCEMVGYLYMDSLGDEAQKKRVLENTYTRGQVALFIQAEQQYGFNDILDWMRYGVTAKLEAGHLDEIHDVKTTPDNAVAAVQTQPFKSSSVENHFIALISNPVPTTLKLEGIIWGNLPSAIINGKSFFIGDSGNVNLNGSNVMIRCLSIQPKSVRIQNTSSGKEQELDLP